VIFDTDVLIGYLRGNVKAARAVDRAEKRCYSVVSYMELLQGARDSREQKAIRSSLVALGLEMLPLSEEIGHRAAIYIEEYSLKVALCPMDALIAATAVENDLPLVTGNVKHFSVVRDIDLRVFRP